MSRAAAYTVVTVAYRSRRVLTAMLQSIPPPVPVIVVDNSADQEDITGIVRARPMTSYIDAGGNVGFGRACNMAARAASQPLLAFVNPDTEVDATVLHELADEVIRRPQCSSCGPLLVGVDGRVRAGSGGWLPTPKRAIVHASGLFHLLPLEGISIGPCKSGSVAVEWIAGTCLMIRRDVFLALDGFASRYFLYQEDMDLGRRLHVRGYQQLLRCDLRVSHVAGTSSDDQDVRHLAWLRASALVDYVFATSGPVTSRIICSILAMGAVLRAGYEILRGRTRRLSEFGTHVITLSRPARTLRMVQAERRRRNTPVPAAPVDGELVNG